MANDMTRMSIKNTINTLDVLMKMDNQYVTPFLEGPPGIGKSQIVKEVARKNGYDTILDIRLSQHDSTDVKGIPSKNDKGELVWLSPEFMPVVGSKYEGTKGVLFFDELNRATHEVLQSVFEIVLDRSIGMKPILDGWFIIAAGNQGYEDNTMVTEMDAALRNRFQYIRMAKPNLVEWLEWADGFGIHPAIRMFIEKFPRFLYFTEDDELITPRSWEKFSHLLKNSAISEVEASGLMGNSIIGVANVEFYQFISTFDNAISANDVLYNFDSIKNKVQTSERHIIHSLNSQLSFILKDIDVNEFPKVIDNFSRYFKTLDSDNQVSILLDIDRLDFIAAFFEANPELNEEGSELNKMISKVYGS